MVLRGNNLSNHGSLSVRHATRGKSRVRAIAVGSSVIMGSVILAGCGTSSPTPSASSKVVTVTFWDGLTGALGNQLQAMVTSFNKTHPNIHVVATYEGSYAGGGAEQEKLLAAIQAHNVPDIAQIEVHSVPVFASVGALMPLTSFVNKSPTDQPQSFVSGMTVSTQYQGTTYAIPFNRSVELIYYNKAMFAAAHITNPPNTWQQLVQDAKVLTHGTGSTKVFGFSPVADWWPWESAVWSGGGHILSPNLSQAEFDQPAALSVLRMEKSLQQNGYGLVESGPEKFSLTTESFITQRVAMDEDSSANIAYVGNQVGTKFQWGTVMMPKDVTRAVPPGGADIAIMEGIPKATAQAAWKFIEWWTSTPQTIRWSEATGYLPLKKAALTDPAYQKFVQQHPQEQAALEEIRYQHQPPPSPHYLGVLGYVEIQLSAIFSNNVPVSTAMHQAAQQANTILQAQ